MVPVLRNKDVYTDWAADLCGSVSQSVAMLNNREAEASVLRH